jgi:aspartyl-tRNA(Asn)/glutamyl-tRNA(Gln) amidotransferase subunit A
VNTSPLTSATTWDEAVRVLKEQDVHVVDISLPNIALSLPAYYVIAPAEAASNLARYDGVRYGHRATEYTDLLEMYEQTRAEGFGSEVKHRILIGTYVLSQDYYEAYYLKAQKIRHLVADDFKKAFEQCDLILGPVSPTAAFDIGAINNNQAEMYLADTYTLSVNLAGLPGMSLPAGFSINGRPIGLQIIGNYFAEAKMLNTAHQFQLATDWHIHSPAL